jgi:hypothetical protein
MPLTPLRRLIVVQTQVHSQPDLVERFGELEVRRRRVHGIATDDDQQVDATCAHVSRQIAQ